MDWKRGRLVKQDHKDKEAFVAMYTKAMGTRSREERKERSLALYSLSLSFARIQSVVKSRRKEEAYL